MKLRTRLHPPALAMTWALSAALCGGLAQAAPVTTPPKAADNRVAPEVLQALESMRQHARETHTASGSDTAPLSEEQLLAAVPTRATSKVETIEGRLLAVGVGAVAGVVAFNLATVGMASVPVLASVGGASAGAAMEGAAVTANALALSRVYGVTSAVAGALVGDYLYRRRLAAHLPSIPADVSRRVSP
jgi:hypothetical protein